MTDATETAAPIPHGEGSLAGVAPAAGPATVDLVKVAASLSLAGGMASPGDP
jgi:hypothetical protein